ncbi:MAG TPA: hypothetical protein VGN88_04855 [Phycisphaerae bacterium]|jgi:hypothetical protein
MCRRFYVFLALVPLLAACSSVYHPLKDGVGFTDVPVGTDNFQITFAGDANMPVAEARRYALLRASELAALRSDPYFQIVDERILLSYGEQYYPGDNTRFVETVNDRHGREHPFVTHFYEPGYMEHYVIPEVTMQVHLQADAADNTIPASYLLNQAVAEKIKLSPGIEERLATLPGGDAAVTIPPAPAPTTKPAP